LSVSKAANQFKRIQQIYGFAISRHLNTAEFENDRCKFKMYYTKIKEQPRNDHSIFILFVNGEYIQSF
jgi:DNA mismatch repair ATPase MutL